MASREQVSLFGEILDWMLAPLLLLWPMSVALTWIVAQGIANRPYDHELGSLAQEVAAQASALASPEDLVREQARDEMEVAVQRLLGSDDETRVYYQVLGERGELVAGDADLPVPLEPPQGPARVRWRDDTMRDEPVRVAYLWPRAAEGDESGPLVQIAETLDKRSRLATEIIKGVILPQFVILPLAVLLVWLALVRGIRPLAELQQRIRRRESTDLSPLQERGVPEELAPLVRALNDLLHRLDQSISAQRHFLADAAHQLKTPLAGLRTQAELAEREIDGGQGDAQSLRHALQQIALGSQRAAHMVNQLLAMARTEDREQALARQPVDLAALVRETVRDFVPKAMDKRIDLGYEGPEAGQLAPLQAQPVLLRELVRNLVDNALQYTPAGGTVTARLVADPFGQVAVLQVEDSGPGVPPAEREDIFRPFYRALGTQVDGTGLGLAIVQEIAQQHGAEVTVTDAHPRTGGGHPGALFTVRFPLDASAQRAQAIAS
ncbi:MAG TPA: sensor histidine kinase N-terminal domain-containing protein [Rubrivivax sp.]|nr:sensor histidine kinase N-terminal domain-containing protein [Burkholderiales bacterium]HNT40401.1 sensor histidine kinase N-terminal domain-containing protein [Rubrivivax sp.]